MFGNVLNSTVAIDAYSFGKNPEKQFEDEIILRELNKAYAGYLCTQDRGDISAELIALNNPRTSFIAEYYNSNCDQVASLSSNSALDYWNSFFQSEPQIGLKSSPTEHSIGPLPLSPIIELNELSVYVNIADNVIKVGLHVATREESKIDIKAVDEFATAISSSLLNQLVADNKPPTTQPAQSDEDGCVDRFASALAISRVGGVQSNPQSSGGRTFEEQDTYVNTFASAGIDDITVLPSSVILKSSMENVTKECSIDDTRPDEIANSIISDVLQPTASRESMNTFGETTNESLGYFSDQITSNILANAFSMFQVDHPAISIQVERYGSLGVNESPRSSRSSSLTGQSITVYEFTDELAENLIRDGLSIAQYTSQSVSVPPQVNAEQVASDNAEQVAEKLTYSIMESLKRNADHVPTKAMSPTLSLASVQDTSNIAKNILRSQLLFSKQELAVVAARMAKRGSFNEHSDLSTPSFPGQLNPRLLTPSSSRHSMGYAWSTASTRDEGSRPVSPIDFDRIALGLVSEPEDYTHIFSKILVSDAILTVSGERPKCLQKSDMEEGCGVLSMTIVPSESKIDAYLSRLDLADGLLQYSGEEAFAKIPSFQQKIKTALLRPIATGNWGCGSFKGDHQLKCMLQWAVASICDRPQMIYYTFGHWGLKEVSIGMCVQCD